MSSQSEYLKNMREYEKLEDPETHIPRAEHMAQWYDLQGEKMKKMTLEFWVDYYREERERVETEREEKEREEKKREEREREQRELEEKELEEKEHEEKEEVAKRGQKLRSGRPKWITLDYQANSSEAVSVFTERPLREARVAGLPSCELTALLRQNKTYTKPSGNGNLVRQVIDLIFSVRCNNKVILNQDYKLRRWFLNPPEDVRVVYEEGGVAVGKQISVVGEGAEEDLPGEEGQAATSAEGESAAVALDHHL